MVRRSIKIVCIFNNRRVCLIDYIEPAMKGTVGILESALKHASVCSHPPNIIPKNQALMAYYRGPQLKRIMITSSGAAMLNAAGEGVANESSWNEDSVKAVREKGQDALPFHKYSASKLFAEKGEIYVTKDAPAFTFTPFSSCVGLRLEECLCVHLGPRYALSNMVLRPSLAGSDHTSLS